MTATSGALGTGTPPEPGRHRLRAVVGWGRAHPGLLVALVLPWLVFGIPLVVGRVFLDGDNFIQNFPLRVLAGQDFRHGQWPLLDPYIYSGAPLLGGFNAGAAYPATWLFGVIPSQVAWTLNLAFVYDTALAGTYLFLRRQPLSTTAATFGAATFAFIGFMSGQIVHIDIIEGSSWLPWMLLAVHALTSPPTGTASPRRRRRHRRWWAGLLLVSTGLTILAGGPEAFLDGGVLTGIYLVYRLLNQRLLVRRHWRWSVPSMVAIVAGVAGGVALGCAQLIPGLSFVGQSQRSTGTYAFFTSGSLPIRTVSVLVSPFVLGTNQTAAPYVGEYNFPEVASYMGILALIGGLALFGSRWRRRPEARQWWIWYPIMVIGMLSALGSQTPFAHLMFVIPGINAQRLLNRNLLLVDFSLAVLSAWFLHLLLGSRAVPTGAGADAATPAADAAPPPGVGWQPRRWPETVLTCVPVTLVALVCVLLWAVPTRVISALGGFGSSSTHQLRIVAVVATVELVIAAAGTTVVLTAGRWSMPVLRRLLTVVLVADLAVFTGLMLHPPVSNSSAHAQTALARQFSSVVGNGRFAIYDPDRFDTTQLYELGQTDLNAIGHLASSQGYAALVDNGYYDATGAHLQEDLDPQTLATPIWDQLNTHVLLSLPSYFVTPDPGVTTSTDFPSPTTSAEDAPPGPLTLDVGQTHHWYLGGVLTASQGTLPLANQAGQRLRVGVVTPAGATRWLPASSVTAASDGDVSFSLTAPTPIAGIVAENQGTGPVDLAAPSLRTTEDGRVVFNGRLQGEVTPPHWVYSGTVGQFGVFVNPRAQGWAWAEGPDGGTAPAGTTVSASAPGPVGTQRVVVHATGPTTLVRSESWTPGWHATVEPIDPTTGAATGPAVATPVTQHGAIQQVSLPDAGSVAVRFTYRTTSAVVGVVISAVTGVALVIWAVAEVVGVRRRRRKRRSRAELSPG